MFAPLQQEIQQFLFTLLLFLSSNKPLLSFMTVLVSDSQSTCLAPGYLCLFPSLLSFSLCFSFSSLSLSFSYSLLLFPPPPTLALPQHPFPSLPTLFRWLTSPLRACLWASDFGNRRAIIVIHHSVLFKALHNWVCCLGSGAHRVFKAIQKRFKLKDSTGTRGTWCTLVRVVQGLTSYANLIIEIKLFFCVTCGLPAPTVNICTHKSLVGCKMKRHKLTDANLRSKSREREHMGEWKA